MSTWWYIDRLPKDEGATAPLKPIASLELNGKSELAISIKMTLRSFYASESFDLLTGYKTNDLLIYSTCDITQEKAGPLIHSKYLHFGTEPSKHNKDGGFNEPDIFSSNDLSGIKRIRLTISAYDIDNNEKDIERLKKIAKDSISATAAASAIISPAVSTALSAGLVMIDPIFNIIGDLKKHDLILVQSIDITPAHPVGLYVGFDKSIDDGVSLYIDKHQNITFSERTNGSRVPIYQGAHKRSHCIIELIDERSEFNPAKERQIYLSSLLAYFTSTNGGTNYKDTVEEIIDSYVIYKKIKRWMELGDQKRLTERERTLLRNLEDEISIHSKMINKVSDLATKR